MLRHLVVQHAALALLLVTSATFCSAQDATTQTSQEAQGNQTVRLDQLAIQDSIAGYLNAINNRDSQTAASFWSESGEWINEDGSRVRGSANIAGSLARSFEQDPAGMQISLRDLTIRFVTNTVAIEDGVAVISIPGNEKTESSYSVVHIKQNGGWKIDSIRETKTPPSPQRHSQLKKLSWLIGNFVDQLDGDNEITTSCSWTQGDKAIRRSFQVANNEGVVLKGTQVIVWDARAGQIRSWIFDSDGGFGSGIWRQQNNGVWTVDSEYQLADCGVGSSTNVYSNISSDSYNFHSINRMADGAPIPDTNMIRVAKSDN